MQFKSVRFQARVWTCWENWDCVCKWSIMYLEWTSMLACTRECYICAIKPDVQLFV